ncbi:MAG: flagellin [Thermoplasmatales archaeon]|nr:flagellin [Thermoplasmatales archaeon]
MRKLLNKDVGSIGIGAMIVFIAMVLVAGIAASVLIQTSTTLESQALATGRDTTGEVASGIAVFDILGYADTANSQDISKLAIGIRPRAGSDGIDIAETYVELSDATTKVVLNYTTSFFLEPDGKDDIFGAAVFPDEWNWTWSDGSKFGVLVIEDADDSITSSTAVVVNRGDKIYLCINATATFSNISERVDMWGIVVPELGAPGVVSFRTPASYTDDVIDLQ